MQVLAELAEQRNRQPLPPLRKRYGLRLPPEEDCLLGANYQLRRDTDAGAAGAAAQPMEVEAGCAACPCRTVTRPDVAAILTCFRVTKVGSSHAWCQYGCGCCCQGLMG